MRSEFEPSRLVRFNTVICGLALGLAVAWTMMLGTPWLSRTFLSKPFLMVCLASAALYGTSVFYRLIRPEPALARMLHASALLPVMIVAAIVLTYLVPTLQMPMADAKLASFDAAFGFDFPRFVAWAVRQPIVRDWASPVYGHVTVALIFLTFVTLIATKQAAEFERCLGFLVVATILTIALAALLPAGSAFAYHRIPPEAEAELRTVVGADYNTYYAQVRAGDISVLDTGPKGMVSFPSFHTILGLMCVFHLRATPWLQVPVAIAAGLMIATTPLIGGHFLADIGGGSIVAGIAYWLVDRIATEKRPAVQALQVQKA